jgi:hypothetical protein
MSDEPIRPGLRDATLHLGFVVTDLEAAMAQWTAAVGAGPWIVIEGFPAYERIHRGRPTNVTNVLAVTYHQDLQIELNQQLDDFPSPYRDFLEGGGTGLQHVGLLTDRFEMTAAELVDGGFSPVYTSGPSGSQHPSTYFEGSDPEFPMVEILELSSTRVRAFGLIRELVRDWDGSDPIRRYPSMSAFVQEQSDRRPRS